MSFDYESDASEGGLFREIPFWRKSREQYGSWDDLGDAPTYEFLRTPHNLREIESYNQHLILWRDNHTLTFVCPGDSNDQPAGVFSYLCLVFYDRGPTMFITGDSDEAIAETAAFFIDLVEPTQELSPFSVISINNEDFDFCSVGTARWARLLEEAPACKILVEGVMLSAEQSVVLATRPHRIELTFFNCSIEDGGTAFTDALVHRTTPFGSLKFQLSTEFTDENLERIIQVNVLDHLELPGLGNDELELRTFSAPVDSFEGLLYISSPDSSFESLNIVARKLAIRINGDVDAFPTQAVISFFRRLATVRHFVALKIRFTFIDYDEIPDIVVEELIRAALANHDLKELDLFTIEDDMTWDSHFVVLFDGLKDHPKLERLKIMVDSHEEAFGPDYVHLRKLITYNRNIAVTDDEGYAYTDGPRIDALYELSWFYCDSVRLGAEPTSIRSLLVVTALVECTSHDFQRSALLLAHHADALCELVQSVNETDGNSALLQSVQDQKRIR
ncbi:hypothetical protein FisN_26Hu149 [Fistulifera solaris]|uniref:Uncharacterized protein n=1 Tax=Fistulifera solaris TaxID=1519565 RepID=A0A1Z5JXU6_FISSO|nr:hypothetical protein FisN_26Hu149 [Fistulifera solaris]|eukprot:GAX18847.1 hypothetical protein FisN_26Hu149 [Fistulifera solaris]